MNTTISNPDDNHRHLYLIEDLLLVFILVFSFGNKNQWWPLQFILITALLLAHFTKLRIKFPIAFWGLTLLLTSLDIIQAYFVVANHSFVLFYMTSLVLLSYFYPLHRINILKINSLSILVLILFWGAVQKVLSPSFLNGDYISLTTIKGQLFKPLLLAKLIPDVFAENITLINEFRKTLPHPETFIQLKKPFAGFESFSYYFSLFIIVSEFLMVPVLFLKNNNLKNSFILLFLSGLLFTRFETGFISLLIILSVAQLPATEKTFRFLYLGLFAVCITLMLLKIGLR